MPAPVFSLILAAWITARLGGLFPGETVVEFSWRLLGWPPWFLVSLVVVLFFFLLYPGGDPDPPGTGEHLDPAPGAFPVCQRHFSSGPAYATAAEFETLAMMNLRS